jgi:MFS family permease
MKWLRQVGGFLVGYGISMFSSVAWFLLMHRPPHMMQPAWFIAATAVYGIAFSILAGYVAASIGNYPTGFAVAVAIFVASVLSSLADPRHSHWSQVVALVCMCPAAVLGAKLRMRLGRRT